MVTMGSYAPKKQITDEVDKFLITRYIKTDIKGNRKSE